VHLKEIKNVYKLYLKTHNKVDNVLFIFAIRHPDKSNDFYKKLTKKKLKVARKSKNEKIEKNTDIYMYDEMGEMGTFYVLSDVVVMCGSFVKKIGGHNPIEVAKCEGGAILTAPFIKGNKVLFQELEKQTGCIICKNKRRIVSDMRDNITFLFHKPKKIKEMSKNAYNVTKKFSNVANDMAKSIKREIES
ncbi:MAG: hypothetical protein LBT02_00745, partial [Rickettsiales bacterium]|nr:hypothetical protein [Rickettsiales bacterium]